MEASVTNKLVIFVISNEEWGKQWLSKHHYANELAKLGFTVYFVDPVKRWKFVDLFSLAVVKKKVKDNLHILFYRNNFPIRFLGKFFLRLNDYLNSYKLSKITGGADVLWWNFDPFRFINTDFFYESKTIYHVVDPYSHFWQDRLQAENADLIVCTNQKYADTYCRYGFSPLFIPHGISKDEFTDGYSTQVRQIRNEVGEFAIIVGAVNNEWDFELLKSIVDKGVKILILGQETNLVDWNDLKANPNIVYQGVVHAKNLKHYINAAKVCLVPYKKRPGKHTRSPLKFLNYLAQYKPIITSFDPFLDIPANRAIYFADKKEDFVRLTKRAMNDNLTVDKRVVQAYLDEHEYPVLIDRILNELKQI